MNKLSIEQKAHVLRSLVEGTSIRGTVRITGVAKNTIVKLLTEVGKAAETFHNETVNNLQTSRIEMDEIWSFVYSKEKNIPEHLKDTEEKQAGDVWTWTAIDADSKLMISWLVADRGTESGLMFVQDVASRLTKRIQVSTDAYNIYRYAIDETFGAGVDFATITKQYGNTPGNDRYTSAECIGTKKTVVTGKPDRKKISTSFVERQNLTMRMSMRRFTRSTNAFSKKMENHRFAVALHFFYYNFVRIHQTLKVTPAIEAGLTERPLTLEFLAELSEKLPFI